MATISKVILSGSTDGNGITVSATTGADGALVHTGPSTTTSIDEIFLYGNNDFTASVELILEYGQSLTNTVIISHLSPRAGLEPIVPGLLMLGNATPKTIRAYLGGVNGSASAAASGIAVSVYGFVNQIV